MDDNLTKAKHYRDKAAHMRALASEEDSIETRKALLSIAETYDQLYSRFLERSSPKH